MVKQNNQVHMTKEGLEELQEELQQLKDIKLPQMIDRVAKARDFGDLSENAEYSTSKAELELMEGRVDELEDIIARAKVINSNGTSKKIGLGSKITVEINEKKHQFTLVGEWEADPTEKKISHDSPLGKALLGRGEGDKVEVEAPAGKVLYHIVKIH
ncbi:transcription elongation factor GreA [Candidatus Beckwithbacteria bacterium]|nr:transcription elongation factor GreA [Candidatus Beckwithbacteria bacterium]